MVWRVSPQTGHPPRLSGWKAIASVRRQPGSLQKYRPSGAFTVDRFLRVGATGNAQRRPAELVVLALGVRGDRRRFV